MNEGSLCVLCKEKVIVTQILELERERAGAGVWLLALFAEEEKMVSFFVVGIPSPLLQYLETLFK